MCATLRSMNLYQLISDLGLKLIEDVKVITSIMVMCNANSIVEYDRRRSRPPSAPLDIEYAKQYRVIVL